MTNKIDSDIFFYLKRLDNHAQRFLYSLYERKDIQDCSLMNMWVTDFLFDNQERDIYQKDIEKEFFINRATASKMLSLMEEKELIRRTASRTDARQKKIELLPKGYELQKICVIVRGEMEKRLRVDLLRKKLQVLRLCAGVCLPIWSSEKNFTQLVCWHTIKRQEVISWNKMR